MKVDSKSAKMLVCAAGAAMGLTVSAATPIVKDGKAVAAVRIDGSDHVQIAYAAQELTTLCAAVHRPAGRLSARPHASPVRLRRRTGT